MQRVDGRQPDQLRPLSIERGFMKHAEGSALIKMGDTHIICTASVEERVPPFLVGKKKRLGHLRIRNVAPGNTHPLTT